MNNKENLFFVAKCLTLDQNPEKIVEVRDVIRNDDIDWENIVRVSSGQFVLPALYLQLKRNGLIEELPADLIEHFEEITQLNRERNQAILTQVEDVTKSLNRHNIFPVYLKGVAHLLKGLYIDPAERMIGDIDFLVPEDQMVEAAEILIEEGYKPLATYYKDAFKKTKHYPRLVNSDFIAAVEIHKEVLNPPRHIAFPGNKIAKEKELINCDQYKAFIPCIEHLIIHNVYNNQINDKASIYGNIILRQMYDISLLAINRNIIEVAKEHKYKFNTFNNYYAQSAFVFSNPKSVIYLPTWRSNLFLKRINFYVDYPIIKQTIKTIIYFYTRIIRYITLPILSIFQTHTRRLLIIRLKNPQWYRAHFRSYINFFKH